MPLELCDVHFDDGPSLAHLHVSAFYDDIFNQTLFPNVAFGIQESNTMMGWPRKYANDKCRFQKVIDTATGEIVSYSRWTFVDVPADLELPGLRDMPEDYEFQPERRNEGRDVQFSLEFSDKCTAAKAQAVGNRARMELNVLATSPTYQRRGAASLMLKWATQFADQNDLVCMTIASMKGLPLYSKFGFEVQERITMPMIDGSTYTSTCIVRESR